MKLTCSVLFRTLLGILLVAGVGIAWWWHQPRIVVGRLLVDPTIEGVYSPGPISDRIDANDYGTVNASLASISFYEIEKHSAYTASFVRSHSEIDAEGNFRKKENYAQGYFSIQHVKPGQHLVLQDISLYYPDSEHVFYIPWVVVDLPYSLARVTYLGDIVLKVESEGKDPKRLSLRPHVESHPEAVADYLRFWERPMADASIIEVPLHFETHYPQTGYRSR